MKSSEARNLLWLFFQFRSDEPNVCIPDVFHRVRRQRIGPLRAGRRWWRRNRSAVKQQFPLVVAPQKIAPALDVYNSRPAMRVYRHKLARLDAHLKHAHAIILKQQLVKSRRRRQRIQRFRPWPFPRHSLSPLECGSRAAAFSSAPLCIKTPGCCDSCLSALTQLPRHPKTPSPSLQTLPSFQSAAHARISQT